MSFSSVAFDRAVHVSVDTVKIMDSFRLLWTAEVGLAEAWNSFNDGWKGTFGANPQTNVAV